MNQSLALEIMFSGESIFLTGAAGSGKTFVLNEFIRHAKQAGKKVAVTATTGLAASHLGGSTIHSWSGIGIHDVLPNNFFTHMPKGRQETIQRTDVLIIDEISMLHDTRLDVVDQVLRHVRKEEKPFGGLQVIFCGDFFQLPPIVRGREGGDSFAFRSEAWEEVNPVVCYLEEQYRQNDTELLDILTALRSGDIRRRHAETLLERVNQRNHNREVTELHTTNADVDQINDKRLTELPGDEVSFEMHTTGAENYVETLKKACLAPEILRVKEGALVMALKNHPNKTFVNGSIGVVKGFEDDTLYPIVEFQNGRTATIMPDSWELRDGDKKRAGLSQVPLRLAYAITIHKSQGMTLDAATIDLSKAFVAGMGYVALSRVRNLSSLHLKGINRMALQVNQEVLAVDQSFRLKTRQAITDFAHLMSDKTSRRRDNPTQAKKTSWAAKLEAMRTEYPNAYRPWSKKDDDLLKEKFRQGVGLKELTVLFGRHGGSILRRLQKHFGEEVVIS